MRDYDVVASDFTEATPGFIGSFQIIRTVGGFGGNLQPNPDVFAAFFH
jgi:hypothetical protein